MKTFKEFLDICEGYVPLRTSDQPYDDEGYPTRTTNWSKKYTNALLNVGMQKFRSGMDIGDKIGNLVKGVSAAARLNAVKKVDAEPESQRARRSQEISQRNRQLGANRRSLQTSMDRQHLTRSLRGGGSTAQGIGSPSSPSGTTRRFQVGGGPSYGISGIKPAT